MDGNGKITKWKKPFVHNFTLCYLASLTPPQASVEIIDERLEDVNFNEDYDLVGITALTSQVTRAYQIADKFREKRKPVVMGGIHATALPEEALEHCDSVVIGEAENVWMQVVEDVMAGRLRKIYKSDSLHDMKNLPFPRYDLLKRQDFTMGFVPVQASRGCPHDCDFCSVSKFFGKSYRFRPVEDVVREIRASGAKRFTFLDDNITANGRYAKDLFRALIPLKIKWIGQCTINFGRDPELCKLAFESGCCFMSIGIESIDEKNLQSVDKSWNKVKEFPQLLRTIRKHGIGLSLNMIVGLDNDDVNVFKKTQDFLMKNHAFILILNTPIPYPGTRLAQSLEDEGRLLYKDWSRYTQGSIVFSPKRLTPRQLKEGYWELLSRFFSCTSILRRARYQSLGNMRFYFKRNLDLRSSVIRRDY